MLEVEKIISYKIDGDNKTYFDYFENFIFCLPELFNDNIKKLFCFSANNYFNDKYYIDISKINNIYEKQKQIIGNKYELIDTRNDITDCVAVIDNKTKKCGFLNLKGEIVIPCVYDYVDEFINGLARVEKNGSEYLINKENTIICDSHIERNSFFDIISSENTCIFYPKHIHRFETLRSLSHPESCKKKKCLVLLFK